MSFGDLIYFSLQHLVSMENRKDENHLPNILLNNSREMNRFSRISRGLMSLKRHTRTRFFRNQSERITLSPFGIDGEKYTLRYIDVNNHIETRIYPKQIFVTRCNELKMLAEKIGTDSNIPEKFKTRRPQIRYLFAKIA